MRDDSFELGTPNHIQLIEVRLDQLVFAKRRLRRHGEAQIRALKSSLERFGFVSPILVTKTGEIVAGEARVTAAKALGLACAPAVRIEHLSEEEIRAYRIADNKLAEAADWDNDALRIEIAELIELDISVDGLGFETGELDVLLLDDSSLEEAFSPEPEADPVTRLGDVWRIGEHRLVCADALKPETYERLLGGARADAVFTDAPYNVAIHGNVCGSGGTRHREFVMASGEMSDGDFREFLIKVHSRLSEALKPGGVAFSCMDWRSIESLLKAGEAAGFETLNLAVWDKGVGGMGSLYRSRHELVAVFKKPGARHRNNVQLGRHGRNRTNIWEYAGCNTGGAERANLKLHPTVKPVSLIADAILDVTDRGEGVLDCFGGSGSTMLAAQQTGRRAFLAELDPAYCDVIVRRMADAFGVSARLEATGETYDAVRGQRKQEAGDV